MASNRDESAERQRSTMNKVMSTFRKGERDLALTLLGEMESGEILPKGVLEENGRIPFDNWGHWTAKYSPPSEEDLEVLLREAAVFSGDKRFAVCVCYDAPDRCSAGPCGEERSLKGLGVEGVLHREIRDQERAKVILPR